MQLHHIAIEVTNAEKSRAFYKEVFGLKEIYRASEGLSSNAGAWFALGDLQLHLSQRAAAKKNGQHFALVTEDFDGVMKRAAALGANIQEAQLLEGFRQRGFLADPDGNRIELLSR